MTTSVIQRKGLPKDYFLHRKGDSLVSQKCGETPSSHNPVVKPYVHHWCIFCISHLSSDPLGHLRTFGCEVPGPPACIEDPHLLPGVPVLVADVRGLRLEHATQAPRLRGAKGEAEETEGTPWSPKSPSDRLRLIAALKRLTGSGMRPSSRPKHSAQENVPNAIEVARNLNRLHETKWAAPSNWFYP